MKKLFGVLLIGVTAATLAACGNGSASQDSTSDTSQKTSQVSKKTSSKKAASTDSATNSASSASSSADASSTSANESTAVSASDTSSSSTTASTTSSAASASATAQSQTATTSADGLNLTTAQVQNWVARNISGNYQDGDLSYAMSKDANGELVIQVRENHNSANMQAQGADTSTAPTIGWYKVNSQGQLLRSPDAGASWNVVSSSYNN
ncbi:hypothetical protein [Loigolactobacillus jiayinensis]|uniref:Lipoprotein n=1 Tax=Loigolactobacillus jiayinensis TaxID=2486016 RepID=A0ABW1REF8_9LACO|nr:hypothetical protein [Loigolactobacillus jiayinensis]